MRGLWLLLRSHSALVFMVAIVIVTAVGCAVGPGTRPVITQNGGLGQPLPFVLALCGAIAMVVLSEPSAELSNTMPRPLWQARIVLVGFILAGCIPALVVSSLVAPGLSAATARNLFLALSVTFLISQWRPLVAWVPTSAYLVLSWLFGTATYEHDVSPWAVPAHGPEWRATGVWAVIATISAAMWVLRPTLTQMMRSTRERPDHAVVTPAKAT